MPYLKYRFFKIKRQVFGFYTQSATKDSIKLIERVESNEVRTRGQPHKASIATDRLRAGMIEPSSWDFSPILPLHIQKKDRSILLLRSLMFWILRAYALRMTFALNLFDRSVIFLKRFNGAVAVPCGGDALHGVVGTGEGRNVRDLVLDGGLADSALEPSAPKCGARK